MLLQVDYSKLNVVKCKCFETLGHIAARRHSAVLGVVAYYTYRLAAQVHAEPLGGGELRGTARTGRLRRQGPGHCAG